MVEISLTGISSGEWFRASHETISSDYGKILLSPELLAEHEAFFKEASCDIALTLSPDAEVKPLVEWFTHLKMIELTVESFTDGRVFSQARALRELGFKGEIKVVGPVIPDQAKFFVRVGVDTLVVENADRVRAFEKVLHHDNLFYQSSADGFAQVSRLRHARSDERRIS